MNDEIEKHWGSLKVLGDPEKVNRILLEEFAPTALDETGGKSPPLEMKKLLASRYGLDEAFADAVVIRAFETAGQSPKNGIPISRPGEVSVEAIWKNPWIWLGIGIGIIIIFEIIKWADE
jgi:hypothetical protein